MLPLLAAALLAAPTGIGADTPLAGLARALRAAESAAEARPLLERLRQAPVAPLGLPSETLGGPGPARLRAATLDSLLAALVRTARRFPESRDSVERLVTGWDWCEAVRGNRPWDLSIAGGRLVRAVPAPPVSIDSEGFAAWGFSPRDPENRYVPRILARPDPSREHARWVHETVSRRCLPHPANGVTPYDELPYVGRAPPPPPPGPAARDEPSRASLHAAVPPTSRTLAPVAPVDGDRGLGLAGNLYYGFELSGVHAVGLVARWSPRRNWFARLGGGVRTGAGRDGFAWSWGLGYEDWRPGTLSVQVNNWGPIFPGESVVDEARLNVAWKLPEWRRGPLRLGSSVSFELPWDRRPAAGLSATLGLRPAWFLLLGTSVALRSGDVRWYYGFGRSDWRPFRFSLAYYNWGPNEVPAPNFVENGVLNLAFSWAL